MNGERDSFRFRREERLKGRNEIRAVFGQGKRVSCRFGGGAKLFVLKNNLSWNRICFTFSRGFGNAVERNRVRRLEREAYRHIRNRLAGGYDIILLVYPESRTDSSAAGAEPDVRKQLEFLFAKAGLLT